MTRSFQSYTGALPLECDSDLPPPEMGRAAPGRHKTARKWERSPVPVLRPVPVGAFSLPGVLLAAALVAVNSGAVRAEETRTDSHPNPIPIARIKRSTPVDFDRDVLPILKNNCL